MAYNILNPIQVVTSGDMSSSITSTPVEVKYQDNIGVQLHWTGTPTGSFAFEVSMNYSKDINGNVVNTGNWVVLPVSPSISAAGSADDAYVDLNQISARYVRVVYTAASGSGTLDVFVNAKGV